MKFDLVRPCGNCPFRTDLVPFLRADFVREILGDPDGRSARTFPADSFACHKTVDYSTFAGRIHNNSQHCAGAALILIRDNIPNTAMQLAERLLGWNPGRLDERAPVYASRRECIAWHERDIKKALTREGQGEVQGGKSPPWGSRERGKNEMTDKINLATGDKELLRAAATGEGAVVLEPDDIGRIMGSLDARKADIEARYPALVEACPYETRLAVAAWVFEHIVKHATEGGSFRFLIYDRLGFGPDAYVPLYMAGGMTISNEFDLSGEKDQG